MAVLLELKLSIRQFEQCQCKIFAVNLNVNSAMQTLQCKVYIIHPLNRLADKQLEEDNQTFN